MTLCFQGFAGDPGPEGPPLIDDITHIGTDQYTNQPSVGLVSQHPVFQARLGTLGSPGRGALLATWGQWERLVPQDSQDHQHQVSKII